MRAACRRAPAASPRGSSSQLEFAESAGVPVDGAVEPRRIPSLEHPPELVLAVET